MSHVHHVTQNIDFVIVAAAELKALRDHARARGWHNLRLLSAGSSAFKYDLGSEDLEGGQDSTVSVLPRMKDNTRFGIGTPRIREWRRR